MYVTMINHSSAKCYQKKKRKKKNKQTCERYKNFPEHGKQ